MLGRNVHVIRDRLRLLGLMRSVSRSFGGIVGVDEMVFMRLSCGMLLLFPRMDESLMSY